MTFEIDEQLPQFLIPYLETEALKRIRKIDMNCGMNYTSFPLFRMLDPYSRYLHSLETAKIIYHFTHDEKQTLAGLFHDISTPVFSHVIDFLNHDHMTQESTEEKTKEIIESSEEIMCLLKKDGICIDEVYDYHIYPIADNDSPKLSADRLQYTLGNMLNYGFVPSHKIQQFFDAIMVGFNEYNEVELVFEDETTASEFAHTALKCGMVYTCCEDRYGMEKLALLLKKAIERNILSENDLYTDEEHVISVLMKSDMKDEWIAYTRMCKLDVIDHPAEGYLQVHAKKRYIDPYVVNKGRVSELDPSFNNKLQEFLQDEQNEYMRGLEDE